MFNLQKLVDKIIFLKKENQNLLIAIDGRGGSGKTTFAKILQNKLSNSIIFHLDEFNYPLIKEDYQKLVKQIITPLKNNQKAIFQVYNYKNKIYKDFKKIDSNKIIIFEGVTTLSLNLEKYFDYKIWIQCPIKIGNKRGIQRELKLTGNDITNIWNNFKISEEKYINDEKPENNANLIIDYKDLENLS